MSQPETLPASPEIITATAEFLHAEFQNLAQTGFAQTDAGHPETRLIRRIPLGNQTYADVTTNSEDFSTASRTIDCRMRDMIDVITPRNRYSLYAIYSNREPGYMFTWHDAKTPSVLKEIITRVGLRSIQQLGHLATAVPPIRTETYHTANYRVRLGDEQATARVAVIKTSEGYVTSRTHSLRLSLENTFDYSAETTLDDNGQSAGATKIAYHDRASSKGAESVIEQHITPDQLGRVRLTGSQILRRLRRPASSS